MHAGTKKPTMRHLYRPANQKTNKGRDPNLTWSAIVPNQQQVICNFAQFSNFYVCTCVVGLHIIRHSPPGMPYGFEGILFSCCFFFRRPGLRMKNFERQKVPEEFQNFCRSKEEVYRFPTQRDPHGWGAWGAPKHPKISPPPPSKFCIFFFLRFRTPGKKIYFSE